mmetsp:Transcript_9178/g.41771  ORF Transcript_9178/g.41771 Transcript_9178/m.41771 type:complete len:213 (-) Transcript_9178:1526-2164(-)
MRVTASSVTSSSVLDTAPWTLESTRFLSEEPSADGGLSVPDSGRIGGDLRCAAPMDSAARNELPLAAALASVCADGLECCDIPVACRTALACATTASIHSDTPRYPLLFESPSAALGVVGASACSAAVNAARASSSAPFSAVSSTDPSSDAAAGESGGGGVQASVSGSASAAFVSDTAVFSFSLSDAAGDPLSDDSELSVSMSTLNKDDRGG